MNVIFHLCVQMARPVGLYLLRKLTCIYWESNYFLLARVIGPAFGPWRASLLAVLLVRGYGSWFSNRKGSPMIGYCSISPRSSLPIYVYMGATLHSITWAYISYPFFHHNCFRNSFNITFYFVKKHNIVLPFFYGFSTTSTIRWHILIYPLLS
jgi:hypothetical protein